MDMLHDEMLYEIFSFMGLHHTSLRQFLLLRLIDRRSYNIIERMFVRYLYGIVDKQNASIRKNIGNIINTFTCDEYTDMDLYISHEPQFTNFYAYDIPRPINDDIVYLRGICAVYITKDGKKYFMSIQKSDDSNVIQLRVHNHDSISIYDREGLLLGGYLSDFTRYNLKIDYVDHDVIVNILARQLNELNFQ